CFEHLWNFSETAVAHDESKSVETDFPLTNVFMSIHARVARGFGIVHMNGGQALETDHAIELTKRFLDRSFSADVVTGSEDVCGVEADANSLGLSHVLDDVGDLLKRATEARTLSGGGLERDPRFDLLNFPENLVDRSGDFLESGFFA